MTDPRFGALVECHCTIDRREERIWREGIVAARMGPGLAAQTFANFVVQRQPVAHDTALAFAHGSGRFFAMFGSTGVGKSHLLAAIANHLIAAGRRPVYWLVADLVGYLQEGYSAGDFPARLEAVKETEVLLLDEYDVGVRQDDRGRNEARDRDEKMFMILNHRLNWKYPTALATNASLGQLPPRIMSRLSDPTLTDGVIMRPGDYRLER